MACALEGDSRSLSSEGSCASATGSPGSMTVTEPTVVGGTTTSSERVGEDAADEPRGVGGASVTDGAGESDGVSDAELRARSGDCMGWSCAGVIGADEPESLGAASDREGSAITPTVSGALIAVSVVWVASALRASADGIAVRTGSTAGASATAVDDDDGAIGTRTATGADSVLDGVESTSEEAGADSRGLVGLTAMETGSPSVCGEASAMDVAR